jgi:hypothetical protein
LRLDNDVTPELRTPPPLVTRPEKQLITRA